MLFLEVVSQLPKRNAQKKDETRCGHAQCTLRDGRVMITGGCNYNGVCRKVDIWDPTTNAWSKGRPMRAARRNHRQHVLADGRVLAVGGGENSLEIYDPAANVWKSVVWNIEGTPDMFASASLRGGDVLFVGVSTRCYRMDVAAGTVTLVAPRPVDYDSARALITLKDGRVLMVCDTSANHGQLYDPTKDAWASTTRPPYPVSASMRSALLRDGRVVFVGRSRNMIYDPTLEAWWTTARHPTQLYHHGMSSLTDGTLVITGGIQTGSNVRMGGVSVIPTGGWTPRRNTVWPTRARQRVAQMFLTLMRAGTIPAELIMMVVTESSSAF